MARPTKYKPEYCKEIIAYFRDFETFDEIPVEESQSEDGKTTTKMKRVPAAPPSITKFATKIGVSRETLHEWKRTHKEFSDAFKQAKQIYEDVITDGAVLGMYNAYFTALIMKNRFDWKEKGEQTHKFPQPMVLEDEDGKHIKTLGFKYDTDSTT